LNTTRKSNDIVTIGNFSIQIVKSLEFLRRMRLEKIRAYWTVSERLPRYPRLLLIACFVLEKLFRRFTVAAGYAG